MGCWEVTTPPNLLPGWQLVASRLAPSTTRSRNMRRSALPTSQPTGKAGEADVEAAMALTAHLSAELALPGRGSQDCWQEMKQMQPDVLEKLQNLINFNQEVLLQGGLAQKSCQHPHTLS
eukprot:544357-Pelagomonas_calceolata.AAC.4